MKRMSAALSLALGFCLVQGGSSLSGGRIRPAGGEEFQSLLYRPDQVLVVYREGLGMTTQLLAKSLLEDLYGLEELGHYCFVDTYLYKTHWNLEQTIKELRRSPYVSIVEPDKVIRLARTPDDPFFGIQWALHNSGQNSGTPDADIDAPEAWNTWTGDHSAVVAVIDTGVDYNHMDLRANMWTNPGETPGNGVDDDGNGYVDDVFGIDAVSGSGDPMDNDGHGSHVAGIIAAVGDNGTGVSGVCWASSIMALRFIDSGGEGSLSDEIECINYAISKGAHIINGSYGDYESSQIEARAIERAGNAGILCAFAAGNDGTDNDGNPHYPSSYDYDNIIAVANSTRNDLLSTDSNYGHLSVDIAAPGSAIRSTIPQNAYASYSGTSMASPHVAGLAALLKSYNPNWSYMELKNRILYRSDPISSMAGLTLTGSRINAARALSPAQALSLSIQAGEGGTTQPAPGNYAYQNITVVTIWPFPDPHFRFLLWTGNVPAGQSTTDPLRLTVNSDMMIQANFERIIYPPRQLSGQMDLNRSLSQKEYINTLAWQADPDNIDIDRYKVYIFEAGTWRLLQLLNSDTFEFQVRNVDGKTAYRYGVSAQNSLGREGERAVVDIQ